MGAACSVRDRVVSSTQGEVMESTHVYSPFTCQSQVQLDDTQKGAGKVLLSHVSPKPMLFWFHFNKPASDKAGHIVVTVHFNGATVDVPNLQVRVPTRGKVRSEQPRFVMAGKAQRLRVYANTAVIE